MLIHTEIFKGDEIKFHFNNGVFIIAKKNKYCKTYQYFKANTLIECIVQALKNLDEASKLFNQIKRTSLITDSWTNNHESAKMLLAF